MDTQETSATGPTPDAIEVFCSYSRKDEVLRAELATHLSILQASGVISSWHDGAIQAGTEWADQIDEHLNSSQIILLLVSPDFLASEYSRKVEVKRALERHNAGQAMVIPIILRDVDWHESPFGKLQALPKDGRPVVNWPSHDPGCHDQAFKDVAAGIRKVAEGLRSGRVVRQPPEKSILPDNTALLRTSPLRVTPKARLMRYAGISVISTVLIAGLAFFAMQQWGKTIRKTTDWKTVNVNCPLFKDCMGNGDCMARAKWAEILRNTLDWNEVTIGDPRLKDCMFFKPCVNRAEQVAILHETPAKTMNKIDSSKIDGGNPSAKVHSKPKVHDPKQSESGSESESLDASPPIYQHQQ